MYKLLYIVFISCFLFACEDKKEQKFTEIERKLRSQNIYYFQNISPQVNNLSSYDKNDGSIRKINSALLSFSSSFDTNI